MTFNQELGWVVFLPSTIHQCKKMRYWKVRLGKTLNISKLKFSIHYMIKRWSAMLGATEPENTYKSNIATSIDAVQSSHRTIPRTISNFIDIVGKIGLLKAILSFWYQNNLISWKFLKTLTSSIAVGYNNVKLNSLGQDKAKQITTFEVFSSKSLTVIVNG